MTAPQREDAAPFDPDRLRAFIAGATVVAAPPLTPELRMHLATEITPIWTMTEEALSRQGLPPPFWAFAWPGGQGLARLILDRPALVFRRRVLALACGGGLEAMAAARAGAAVVWANDIDPVALVAAEMNASLNALALTPSPGDLTSDDGAAPDGGAFDVILAADAFYERAPALRMQAWLRRRAEEGATVLVADAGRGLMAEAGARLVARLAAPTLRALEDRDSREVAIWRLGAD